MYPDTHSPPSGAGRYLAKDLGSVVVGAETEQNGDAPAGALQNLEGEPEKSLQDVRFVIGDYVSCAVISPLANGSVAPAPFAGSSMRGGGAFAGRGYGGPPPRENGFGDGYGPPRRGGRGGLGAGGGEWAGGRGGGDIPSGEWRRGERLPEGRGFSGPSDSRGGGFGRGRGRGW